MYRNGLFEEILELSSDSDDDKEKNELKNDQEQNRKMPFKGISLAFKKLKNDEELLESEKQALQNFIDEFTTLCTNENVVGAVVSRRVLEVNIHSHTKSCRKYDCPCRFLYPRFPSIRTIIAEPIHGVNDEKGKAGKVRRNIGKSQGCPQ